MLQPVMHYCVTVYVTVLLLNHPLIAALQTLDNSEQEEPPNFQINTHKLVNKVSDRFLSFTMEPNVLNHVGDCNEDLNTSMSMIRSLLPAYFRIAGSESNKLFFQGHSSGEKDPEEIESEKAGKFIVSGPKWLKFIEFANKTGLNIIVSLNGGLLNADNSNFDPTNALEFISFSNKNNLNLDWELGFEVNKVSREDGRFLGHDLIRLRRILDIFPRYRNSLILGPDMTSFEGTHNIQFAQNYLAEANDALNIFTLHPDFSKVKIDDDVTGYLSELFNKMNTYLWMKDRIVPRKPIWIAESERAGNIERFSETMVFVQRLGAASKLGASVYLRYPHLLSLFEPTSEYWFTVLYKSLVGNNVLDTKQISKNSTKLHAYSHCTRVKSQPQHEGIVNLSISYEKGSITVYGVNTESVASRISLYLDTKPEHIMHLYSLTTDLSEPIPKTLLNHQLLSVSKDNQLPVMSPKIYESSKSIVVPGKSIFFIVFPDVKARACLSQTQKVLEDSIQEYKTIALASTTSKGNYNPVAHSKSELKEIPQNDKKVDTHIYAKHMKPDERLHTLKDIQQYFPSRTQDQLHTFNNTTFIYSQLENHKNKIQNGTLLSHVTDGNPNNFITPTVIFPKQDQKPLQVNHSRKRRSIIMMSPIIDSKTEPLFIRKDLDNDPTTIPSSEQTLPTGSVPVLSVDDVSRIPDRLSVPLERQKSLLETENVRASRGIDISDHKERRLNEHKIIHNLYPISPFSKKPKIDERLEIKSIKLLPDGELPQLRNARDFKELSKNPPTLTIPSSNISGDISVKNALSHDSAAPLPVASDVIPLFDQVSVLETSAKAETIYTGTEGPDTVEILADSIDNVIKNNRLKQPESQLLSTIIPTVALTQTLVPGTTTAPMVIPAASGARNADQTLDNNISIPTKLSHKHVLEHPSASKSGYTRSPEEFITHHIHNTAINSGHERQHKLEHANVSTTKHHRRTTPISLPKYKPFSDSAALNKLQRQYLEKPDKANGEAEQFKQKISTKPPQIFKSKSSLVQTKKIEKLIEEIHAKIQEAREKETAKLQEIVEKLQSSVRKIPSAIRNKRDILNGKHKPTEHTRNQLNGVKGKKHHVPEMAIKNPTISKMPKKSVLNLKTGPSFKTISRSRRDVSKDAIQTAKGMYNKTLETCNDMSKDLKEKLAPVIEWVSDHFESLKKRLTEDRTKREASIFSPYRTQQQGKSSNSEKESKLRMDKEFARMKKDTIFRSVPHHQDKIKMTRNSKVASEKVLKEGLIRSPKVDKTSRIKDNNLQNSRRKRSLMRNDLLVTELRENGLESAKTLDSTKGGKFNGELFLSPNSTISKSFEYMDNLSSEFDQNFNETHTFIGKFNKETLNQNQQTTNASPLTHILETDQDECELSTSVFPYMWCKTKTIFKKVIQFFNH